MKALFGLYLEWCSMFRLNVKLAKCSVTRLKKVASGAQKQVCSLWMDRWRFKVDVRKQKESALTKEWCKSGRKGPKPVGKKKSKK